MALLLDHDGGTELLTDDQFAALDAALDCAVEDAARRRNAHAGASPSGRSPRPLPLPLQQQRQRRPSAGPEEGASPRSKRERGGGAEPDWRLEDLAVTDLEDLAAAFSRVSLHRPRGLRVTDLTSAEWCQLQVAYTLGTRVPRVRVSV